MAVGFSIKLRIIHDTFSGLFCQLPNAKYMPVVKESQSELFVIPLKSKTFKILTAIVSTPSINYSWADFMSWQLILL